MKKLAALLVLFLLFTSMVFASATFTFSGSCTLIGSDGKIIRKGSVEADRKGVAVTTGGTGVDIYSDSLRLEVGEYSLLSLTDNDGEIIIYLVYGKVMVSATKSTDIALYTPISLIETKLSGNGEIYVVTTDSEEMTYNTTGITYTVFDSIRGKKTAVASHKGYDYIKGELFNIEPEETVTVPNAPVFREVVRKLIITSPVFSGLESKVYDTVPSSPVFNDVKRKIIITPPVFSGLESAVYDTVPSSPVFLDADITYIPSSPLFEAPEKELTGTPEAPSFKSTGVLTVTQSLVDGPED